MTDERTTVPGAGEEAAPDGPPAPDRMDQARSRLGSSVCDWHLDSLLGLGGMATVYAATDRNGARAALKIMHREFVRDDGICARFMREGYVAAKVQHPGCVQIIDDASSEEGEPFLVMELLEGETLHERWKRLGQPIPVADALAVASAVLQTLAACHACGVVHRDLKPGNIFLATDGRIKLLDFGVAQLRERGTEITRAGLALGTPAYMAPEQAMGRHEQIDGRSDLYSMGATLYAVLSGESLHCGRSDAEAQILAATQPAPSLARVAPDLPVQVLGLVDKALQWNRRNRFQSAAEMGEVIAAIVQGKADRSDLAEQQRAALAAAEATFELDWEPAELLPDVPPEPALPDDALELDLDGLAAPVAAASEATTAATGSAGDREIVAPPAEPASTPPTAQEPSLPDDALLLSLDGPEAPPSQAPAVASPRPAAAPVIDGVAAPDDGLSLDLDPESAGSTIGDQAIGAPPAPLPPGAAPAAGGPPVDLPTPPPDPAAEARGVEDETSDRRRQCIEDMFTAMDRLLRTGRQYGSAHPETQSRVAPVHRAITEALAVHSAGLSWTVLPFSFTVGDVPWEPDPPGDLVPYTLSVAGLREVRLSPGVDEQEIRELMSAMMVDANSDPSEIATTLWEAQLAHVQCRIEEDLGGDDLGARDELWSATDGLEVELQRFLEEHPSATQRLANAMAREDIAEAAVMAASADREAARCADDALALDDTTKAALLSNLVLSTEDVRRRHLDVTLDALTDAVGRRDTAIVALALAARTRRLLRLGREAELFATHQDLLERIAADRAGGTLGPSATLTTHAMFTGEALRDIVRMASEWREAIGAERSRAALEALGRLTETLGPSAAPTCLRIANLTPEGGAQSLLLEYVFRVAGGQEPRLIEVLPSLNPRLAQRVLARLLEDGSAETKALVRPLLRSPNAVLRCEALAHLADSSEQLTRALMDLFAGDEPESRLAALDTFVRHRVLSAGPALVREVEAATFKDRSPEEQQSVFQAVYALNPPRAEKLMVWVIGQHGLMVDDALDRTRRHAVRALAARADSDEALEAVDGATRRRPWNSAELRAEALQAFFVIRVRRGEAEPEEGKP